METHEPIALLQAAKEELGKLPECSLAEMLINARADQLKFENRSESLAERLEKLENEIAAAKAILTVVVPCYGRNDLLSMCDTARVMLQRVGR